MGVAERREREREQRRAAILKAAKRLILKHGVEGMSMNLLAESTELNKATLYLYFSEKDDLVDAVVYEGLTLLERAFEEAERPSQTGLQRVLDLVRASFAFYRRHPVYFHAFNHRERRKARARKATPFAARGDEAASRVFGRIADGIRQGIEEGSIRKEIPVDVALVLLYTQIFGLTHMILAKEDIYKDLFHLGPASLEEGALEAVERYLKKGDGGRAGKK